MTCPTSAPSGRRERESCDIKIFTVILKTRKERSFFLYCSSSSCSEEKASLVLKFMKKYSSIPTWTFLRRATFAKSSTSKFSPFNKKAFRGIDYFSSFFFSVWYVLVRKVKAVAKAHVSSADSAAYCGNISYYAACLSPRMFWKTNTEQVTHFCPLPCTRLPIPLIQVFILAQNLPADKTHLLYFNYSFRKHFRGWKMTV